MTDQPASYYRPLGDGRFLPTRHTIGPWTDQAQHLGPPSALLARALLRCEPRADLTLSKLTVDVLGPVPLTELTVTAAVLRPGRTVELVGAELSAAGRPVVRASGWRLQRSDTSALTVGAPEPMPPPEQGRELPVPAPSWFADGYLDSVEWRWIEGSWTEPGPAVVWGRPRYHLVDDEPTDPLCRLLTVADSVGGLSNQVDPVSWIFPNTDLTVHLHRFPHGDWVGLRARTVIGPDGVAVANGLLHDLNGPVGNSSQILIVRSR